MNAPTPAAVTRPPPPPSLGPPPTTHTLKPHHLQILKIFSTVFHQFAEKKLPSEFLLHMYRILLEEVAEVRINITCAFWETKSVLGSPTRDV